MADPFAPASSGGSKQRFQEFLTSGTFKPSAGLLAAGGVVEVLLVGGGGGGGNGMSAFGGGGGGGGAVLKKYLTVTGAVTVTIGASVAGTTIGEGAIVGRTGNTSSFGALLSAPGGGGGGSNGVAGGDGASGGGGSSPTGYQCGGGGGGAGGPAMGSSNSAANNYLYIGGNATHGWPGGRAQDVAGTAGTWPLYTGGQGLYGFGCGGNGGSVHQQAVGVTRVNSGNGGHAVGDSSDGKAGAAGYCLVTWFE